MKSMTHFAAQNKPNSYACAPLTRFAEVRGRSGALQRLQRGSRQLITTQFPNEAFQFPKNHQP